MSLRTLLTALLLTASCSAMADTEVVNLSNRTSADLLPVAQNFIGKDGTVSAYGNQLIVNADPAKIQDLRALLAQLDTPAKRLLITVDTNENNQQNSGDSQTRIISYGTASRDGGIQQIQASEGVPALIQVGQSVPLTTTQQDSYGRLQNQTQYRNVTQGFYVTPSLSGDTVRLQISTNNDRISQERADVVKVQSTDTTVTGKLGEWITLAGYNQQSQAERSASSRSYSTQRGENMTLRVKVDLLD